jgi:hypothetical protein
MLAIGCLMPLVLLAAGGVLGSFAAGTHGGIWGSIIGFASGCGVLLGLLWALERVRQR